MTDDAMAQSALSGWGDSDDDDDSEVGENPSIDSKTDSGRTVGRSGLGLYQQPSMDDDSCPWCLAPATEFREHDDGTVGCTGCGSVIPVDADWYQRGEKIVMTNITATSGD